MTVGPLGIFLVMMGPSSEASGNSGDEFMDLWLGSDRGRERGIIGSWMGRFMLFLTIMGPG